MLVVSGTGHKTACKIDTLLNDAARAVKKSAALRRATSHIRTKMARPRSQISVLPCFQTPNDTLREPAVYLVAVVFSAGGLQPLIQLLHGLPPEFPAAVAVANHMGHMSCLPELLRNQTSLRTKFAAHGESLRAGTVYICPPQHHLVVNPDATIALSSHTHVRYARPSADWFLRTVAGTFGKHAAAVVLSGASADGAEGIVQVAQAGGLVLVQEPATCLFSRMPQAALDGSSSCVALCPEKIASALTSAVSAEVLEQARTEWEQPFGPDWAA